ncbi:6-phosphogluconolactonase/Glucosamine-6-phosphateisomerase/deaminase (NagB) (PDB:2RI0) (PUBMED:24163345) [Commensalibacter communis]|uniref:6-phosphogluconolactonase n=1 Tax=Commensalibacter communis TaxID=2972786 RepID=A0A9W4TQP0_9PROT|nr:6-phosphogluconolactonase [Commensalibacter communis]CAI3934580.1 6-phosphogluconolactonase/Glucosamine-6-phosphateisomerase/deaminase (NagB) (PDB:2RI0) (PUBMED:24163345) [Commensalibacter communis]CAI3936512.1 6-phosphogluconolactonase/Glucosamine-6-phosphateisomerase/deaminase (NagB) (PDB:2RI0) (PUBMED:24163345) [Commensalibacter communis]CAI3942903.1 6-phosphogluconolactonase/Glucosamine-6-phosphateisomerase/deaminase (NagB) (PDB:2RI0) (PUBMED:24163345) [Commensalibacter communis]CAI39429
MMSDKIEDTGEKGHTATTGYVLVLSDVIAQAEYLASSILHHAEEKEQGETLRIALSGGSTPKRLYELLGSSEYADRMPWHKIHLFFGDERMVPHTDSDSNFHMVKESLLAHIDIPFRNVHPMPVLDDPVKAAEIYQAELQAIYGSDTLQAGKPLFDIVLLGLGGDGHTASLFPGTPVLEEKDKWVSWSQPSDAPHKRMTLTYPAIASSRFVMFVVSGENKAQIIREVRDENKPYPSAAIKTEGELHWILDRAAGGE